MINQSGTVLNKGEFNRKKNSNTTLENVNKIRVVTPSTDMQREKI